MLTFWNSEHDLAARDFQAALDDVLGDFVIQNALENAQQNRDPTIRPGAVLRRLGISEFRL